MDLLRNFLLFFIYYNLKYNGNYIYLRKCKQTMKNDVLAFSNEYELFIFVIFSNIFKGSFTHFKRLFIKLDWLKWYGLHYLYRIISWSEWC